ncbi:MAG: hypothetical protein CMJ87_02195 [Planctomycetes bacterium]|nr:hypothetical protein [Planctomycetota bacterium]
MSPFVRRWELGPTDRNLALATWAILLAIFTATFSGAPATTDGEVEFQATSALARRGSLALGGTPEAALIIEEARRRAAEPGSFPVIRGARAASEPSDKQLAAPEPVTGAGLDSAPIEEAWYGWFGPGQAILGLPFYGLGRICSVLLPHIEERHGATTRYGAARSEYFPHLLVAWRNPLLAALTGALLVLCARHLGTSSRSALLAALLWGLTTFAWPATRSTLSDVQATFLLFLAFHGILRARARLVSLIPIGWGPPLELGLALAAAALTRVALLPAVLGLLLVALWVLRRHRHPGKTVPPASGSPPGQAPLFILRSALPLAAGLALGLILNHARFGSPFETGYGPALATFFGFPLHRGLAGLLLSPGRGLLPLAPAVLLLVPALAHIRRDGDRLCFGTLVIVLPAVFIPVALSAAWHGAWSYGPRYLLPALPFLFLAVALGLDQLRGRRYARPLVAAMAILGLWVQLGGVLVDQATHQDLATRAARLRWEATPEEPAADADLARFEHMQWDLGFAAPLAHWRILRHRLSVADELFPAGQVFAFDSTELITPFHPRDRGWNHLVWFDLQRRLGVSPWPILWLLVLLLVGGMSLAARNLDP